MKKKLLVAILSLFICLGVESGFVGGYFGETFSTVEAHSGRTDGSGGHRDNKNKSGLGSYHYHCGGHPAHLHSNGICPYSSNAASTSSSSNTQTVVKPPAPAVVVHNAATRMLVGDNQKLNVQLKNCDSTTYTIESSNENIIKVNWDNSLSAVGVGTAKITVKNAKASKTISITVKAVPVTSIEIKNITEEIQLDSREMLKVEVLPENATYKNFTIESSNEEIITVVGNRIIEACGVGEAELVCKAENGITATYKIAVYEVFPEEIKTNYDDLVLEVGTQETLEVVILPENANDKSVEIAIEDENVLQLDENNITARMDGKTNIVITTSNNIVKKIPVEVFHEPVTDIVIDSGALSEFGGNYYISNQDELILRAHVLPENATYQDIAWKSSNEEIVKIKNNEFEIIGTGKVVLTANASDGVTSEIEINVVDKGMLTIISMCGLAGVSAAGVGVYRKKKSKAQR